MLLKKIKDFVLLNEQGQGMVEYALIMTFVALAIVLALSIFGLGVKNMYTNINNQITF